jgi:hypothetical protein
MNINLSLLKLEKCVKSVYNRDGSALMHAHRHMQGCSSSISQALHNVQNLSLYPSFVIIRTSTILCIGKLPFTSDHHFMGKQMHVKLCKVFRVLITGADTRLSLYISGRVPV